MCNCNKSRQQSPGLEARRAAAAPAPAPAVQAPAPVQQTTQARTTPIMQGGSQSFALQSGDKTARFGSRLERDAAAARTGGKIV